METDLEMVSPEDIVKIEQPPIPALMEEDEEVLGDERLLEEGLMITSSDTTTRERNGESVLNREDTVAGNGGEEQSEEEDGEVYEVEAVLQERSRRGVKEYLVKWKGYGPEYDTWEPEDNLNCDDIIEAYERNKTKKGTPGRKRKAPEEKTPPVVVPKPPPAKRGRKPKVVEEPKEPVLPKRRGRPPTKDKKDATPKATPAPRKKPKPSSDQESDDGEPATIIRCKTRFKKFLIEHAIRVEDDRDSGDDSSEDPLKKYFFKYDLDTGIFTVGDKVVDVNEEGRYLVCNTCNYQGPPWRPNRSEEVARAYHAKDLSIRMMHHVIGQHLGGYSCPICDKNQLCFYTRTYRVLQFHLNDVHKRKPDYQHCDDEPDDGGDGEAVPDVPPGVDITLLKPPADVQQENGTKGDDNGLHELM